jgi:hypothetical protein
MDNNRVYKLYLVSKKTYTNECVFESENAAECFDKLEELRSRNDFTRKYYKNDFMIFEERK